ELDRFMANDDAFISLWGTHTDFSVKWEEIRGQDNINGRFLSFFSGLGQGLVQRRLGGKKTFECFAWTNDVSARTVDHDFSGARAGVVLTCHGESICTGRHDGQYVSLFQVQAAITCKPIAAFANGTHNVV